MRGKKGNSNIADEQKVESLELIKENVNCSELQKRYDALAIEYQKSLQQIQKQQSSMKKVLLEKELLKEMYAAALQELSFMKKLCRERKSYSDTDTTEISTDDYFVIRKKNVLFLFFFLIVLMIFFTVGVHLGNANALFNLIPV